MLYKRNQLLLSRRYTLLSYDHLMNQLIHPGKQHKVLCLFYLKYWNSLRTTTTQVSRKTHRKNDQPSDVQYHNLKHVSWISNAELGFHNSNWFKIHNDHQICSYCSTHLKIIINFVSNDASFELIISLMGLKRKSMRTVNNKVQSNAKNPHVATGKRWLICRDSCINYNNQYI